MRNYIIANATALSNGGALTILKQFIKEIPEDNYNYIVFVDEKINIEFSQNNITLVPKKVKSFFKRFLWDCFGLKNWIKKNKIIPVAAISLQNTNFRTDFNIPNFVYYHQSIPFFEKNWNVLRSRERILWFYKTIYPFFIKLFLNKKTEIFVQLNFIKEAFSIRFHFPKSKIHVVRPNINLPEKYNTAKIQLDKTKLNLFYPAIPFIYKNHDVLIHSLLLLDTDVLKNVRLYLTCEEKEIETILVDKLNKIDVIFMGKIPFSKVLELYVSSDALVFPSYIETFGLPLIEAASLGSSIIAADLPYSREVLEGYKGVSFVKYNDPKSWSEQIELLNKKESQKHGSLKLENKSSWPEFFNIIKNKIQADVKK